MSSGVENFARRRTSSRNRVVLVSGWTPGPLEALGSALSSRHYEVEWLAVPTPPAGCMWLLNPFLAVFLALVVAGFFVVKHLLTMDISWLPWKAVAVVVTIAILVFAARLVVAKLVQHAIGDGVRRLRERLCASDGSSGGNTSQPLPALVVGFSWGACVIHWLLASNAVGAFEPVPMLLLAPPARAMSWVCRMRNPPLFPAVEGQEKATEESEHNSQREQPDASSTASIMRPQYRGAASVVTATADPFCPHPDTWKMYAAAGCEVYTPDDDHVLLQRSSVATVVDAAMRLLSS